jgi:hypothetical protein
MISPLENKPPLIKRIKADWKKLVLNLKKNIKVIAVMGSIILALEVYGALPYMGDTGHPVREFLEAFFARFFNDILPFFAFFIAVYMGIQIGKIWGWIVGIFLFLVIFFVGNEIPLAIPGVKEKTLWIQSRESEMEPREYNRL